MTWFRPLPKAITRPASILILVAWVAQMSILVNRSYLQAPVNLAADLARYGSAAQWRGVYYRGEKLGFTVSQTVPTADGFELQEDGRLQMTLLGAHTVASLRTTAQVDRAFQAVDLGLVAQDLGDQRARSGLQALGGIGELALDARRHLADQLPGALQSAVVVLRSMVRHPGTTLTAHHCRDISIT